MVLGCSSSCPSSLSYIVHQCLALGVVGSSSEPDSSRCLVCGGAVPPHQCTGDADGHSGLKRFSSVSFGPVICVNEQQCYCCCVSRKQGATVL